MAAESKLEAYLVRRVRELGGITLKLTSPGVAGVPDRIVILGGEVGFLELKAPGKKPTVLQAGWLLRIAHQGILTDWTDNRDGVDVFLATL